MKSVALFLVGVIAVVSAAPQVFQRQYRPLQPVQRVVAYSNPGRYSGGGDDGQYHPDDSGSYSSDGSGSYQGSDGSYRHQDDPYRHQGDVFGGSGGGGSYQGGSGGSGAAGSSGGANSGSYRGAGTGIGGSSIGFGGRSAGFGGQVSGLKQGSAAGLYDNRNYGIIRKVEQVEQDGYHYLYETENGILGEEEGHLENKGSDSEAMRAKGYFTYTGPDSIVYTVRYTADENGFVPSAAHLPTPPPIPAAIARALEYQRAIGVLKD